MFYDFCDLLRKNLRTLLINQKPLRNPSKFFAGLVLALLLRKLIFTSANSFGSKKILWPSQILRRKRLLHKMAKLNAVLDSDDDLPELSTFLQSSANPAKKFLGREGHQGTQRESSLQNKTLCNQFPHIRDEDVFSENLAKSAKEVNPRSNQRSLGPLKLLQNNALFLPFTGRTSEDDSDALLARDSFRSIKSSPRRTAKAQVDNSKFIPRKSKQEPLFSESDGELSTDLSGFIVPDSATDEDVLPLRSQRSQKTKTNLRNTGKSRDAFSRKDSLDPTLSQSDEKEDTGPIDLTSPRKEEKSNRICPESPPRLKTPPKLSSAVRTCSDLDDPFSKLRLDPPKIQSASESKDILRPITPPSSLPKSKLKSPSKRNRVPASPHRPSIDAFWSADVINDWNEQYSPRKPLPSPRNKKLYSVGEDEDEISPSESPRKRSPNKSPAKRDKVATENRKAFDDKKHDLATSFLTEVDQAIGDGQVASLAESTGGIKVVWSKKLSSTAGRANWRREAIRSKSADSTVSITTHRHYASIELAEKVIDDEGRRNHSFTYKSLSSNR